MQSGPLKVPSYIEWIEISALVGYQQLKYDLAIFTYQPKYSKVVKHSKISFYCEPVWYENRLVNI